MRNWFFRNGEMTFRVCIPAGTLGYDESFLTQAKLTLHELDLKDLSNDDIFKSITKSEVSVMTQHILNAKIKFLTKF